MASNVHYLRMWFSKHHYFLRLDQSIRCSFSKSNVKPSTPKRSSLPPLTPPYVIPLCVDETTKQAKAERNCTAALSIGHKTLLVSKSSKVMILVSQAPCGAMFASKCSLSSSPKFITSNSPPFPNPLPKFITRRPFHLTLAKAEANNFDSSSPTKSSSSTSTSTTPNSPFANNQTVFVGGEDVPLEGVIQFEKPTSSSRLEKWGRVALLAGGDVLALLLFATIGRFSHGLSVFNFETLRTADPFIAGWFLGAYFLGGYGEDGRGMKGLSKGVIATAKSWTLGIPIGIAIRTVSSGHFPNYGFVFVSLGSTAVLLITFRALLYTILPVDNSKKSDVYRRGSPFELFELLTSLVRRW